MILFPHGYRTVIMRDIITKKEIEWAVDDEVYDPESDL